MGAIREAAKPPVSELESPKLKMAGNSQTLVAKTGLKKVVATVKSTKQDGKKKINLVVLRDSMGESRREIRSKLGVSL